MNYLFFAVKENPVITHSFLQMDCFHVLINDVILWRNLLKDSAIFCFQSFQHVQYREKCLKIWL